MARRIRMKSIEQADAGLAIHAFRTDIASGKIEVYSLTDAEYESAGLLLERFAIESKLRALDALQLAVALKLRERGLVSTFVASDEALCAVAAVEGFTVVCPR